MEYGRFIELLGRIVERGGTILHLRGEHYSAYEGSPACVIIDESRNSYFLTEIGMPPSTPATDEILQTAINEYSNANGIDPFILRMFTVLGEDMKVSRFHKIDDPELDTTTLQKKSALVVIDESVPAVTAFADSMGFEYITVPLKGMFTIYFFDQAATTEIEAIYNKVSDMDEVLLDSSSQEAVKEAPALPNIDIDTAEASIAEQALEPQAPEPELTAKPPVATEPALAQAPVQKPEPVYLTAEPEGKQGSFYSNLSEAAELLYSFLFFAPALLLYRVAKKIVPEGVAYLFGAICAFFGVYYYPVKLGLELLINAMLNYSEDIVGRLLAFVQNISGNLHGLIPTSDMAAVDMVGSLAVYMLSFDAALLGLLNSHYYLQYLLVFAFIVAIVPAFRIFGRRMIGFLIILYALYIPIFIIGHWAVSSLIAKFTSPRSIDYSADWVFALVSSLGGTLAISLLLPVLAVLLATKLCRGIKSGL